MIQNKLVPNTVHYSYGAYNKYNDKEQWIRLTEGCPHQHPFCYEPSEMQVFGVPEIVRNQVKIMDMNLLCKKEALSIIRELGEKRVDGNVVYYQLVCGIDYRFLTSEIAVALKKSRFKKIRLAWDFYYSEQFKIKDAIDLLLKAGYKSSDLMVFMICNWEIHYTENLLKLDLLKVWNVKVSDCWFDNQVSPRINPIHWTAQQIRDFRKKCRRHNIMVNFGVDLTELRKKKLRKRMST